MWSYCRKHCSNFHPQTRLDRHLCLVQDKCRPLLIEYGYNNTMNKHNIKQNAMYCYIRTLHQHYSACCGFAGVNGAILNCFSNLCNTIRTQTNKTLPIEQTSTHYNIPLTFTSLERNSACIVIQVHCFACVYNSKPTCF